MNKNQKKLRTILQQVKEQGVRLATVFDLDSTLFCTHHRTKKIIQASFQHDYFKKNCGRNIEELKKFKIAEKDWSIQDIFEKQGFERNHPAVRVIRQVWDDLFFKGEYLHYDKPYEGGSDFINRIKEGGAEIFYLTARSQLKMKEGTLRSLKKWNFPLKTEDRLILKKDEKMEDAVYKCEELKNICVKFKKVFFFENEPVVLNFVHEQLPQVKLFWIDSVHSGRQTPSSSVQVLVPNYSLK